MPPDFSSSRRSSTDLWDYYYPDIQIINPTPKVSPCPSERDLRERTKLETITTPASVGLVSKVDSCGTSSSYYNQYSRKILRKGSYNNSDSIEEEDPAMCMDTNDYKKTSRQRYDDTNELKLIVRHETADPTNNNHIYHSNNNSSSFHSVQYPNEDSSRRAPLASLSSFKISSVDYQDSDLKSLGSDSVFVESYADTDDDMEQFSTDSDEISLSLGTDHQKVDQQPQKQSALDLPSYSHKLTDISHTITIDSNKKLLSTNKRTRPTLERHRTISSTSNDRIMLISQQSQELPMHELNPDGIVTRGSSFDRSDDGAQGYSIPTSSRSSGGGTGGSCTTGTTQKTDLQKPTTSFSYDNNNDSVSCSSSSVNNINRFHKPETADGHNGEQHYKSKSSYSSNNSRKCENVEVNVIIENRPTQTATTISPSVILELPVIALPSQANNDDEDDPPRDPSLPGTSRKWSKETLF